MPPLNSKQKAALKRRREGGAFAPHGEPKEKKGRVEEGKEAEEVREEMMEEEDVWEGFSNEEIEEVEKEIGKVLRWKEVKTEKPPGKARYLGDSERSLRRKKVQEREKQEEAKGCKKITQMFQPIIPSPAAPPPSNAETKMELEEALEELEKITGGRSNKNSEISKYDFSRYLSLRLYFSYVLDGMGKMKASEKVAKEFLKKGPWQARRLREWGNEFLEVGALSQHFQGAHSKTPSLIQDPVFFDMCQEWASSQQPEKRTPSTLKAFIQEKIFPELGLQGKIHENTCRAYLERLGYTLSAVKKDVYVDGHERQDVKDYRKEWVKRMLQFEKRMDPGMFSLEGEKGKEQEEEEEPRGRLMIQVTHDECCFFANDGKDSLWLAEEEQVLRKKGEGKPFMVSGFLCPCHGIVDLEFISPGKNSDGYWQNDHMLLHVAFSFLSFPSLLFSSLLFSSLLFSSLLFSSLLFLFPFLSFPSFFLFFIFSTD